MSYRGLVGLPNLDYSTLAVSRRHSHSKLNRRRNSQQSVTISNSTEASRSTDYELPPFIRILNLLLLHTPLEKTGSNNFITNVQLLDAVSLSETCPILGTGRHFTVYASPFDSSDHDFKPIDGRAFNNEVYCIKAPNFISGRTTTPGPAKDAFRNEYYDAVLQELRVLLHPHLRSHDNIINLFGLDFQEDYDDCTTAWPVLVMENAEYGTLDILQQDIHLDSELARILLLDVARGIEALHQCNIIHGDVKSENVLICRHKARPYVARLSDFGLSVINPDEGREDHHLPGGTFLWRAPEFERALSIQGLQQTDVYSFGLTVWRVLVNDPNPYSLIPLAALGLQNSPALSEVVNRAKAHPRFTQLVLQTMETSGFSQIYALRIIESTLGRDPASRDLSSAISVFAMGKANIPHERVEPNEAYWSMEEPSLVMGQLEDVLPERLILFAFRASIIRSLVRDLESEFSSTEKLIAQIAVWLVFQFAASSLLQVAKKGVDECCRMLLQLCDLESILGQAIVVRYHEVYGKEPATLVPEWLEVAATNGSYYAMESLHERYPERYQQLMGGPLDFEVRSADLEEEEAALLKCCREGDYAGCKALLCTGVSAFPSQKGMVSALHWLVSFHDERQINDLVELLLGHGAVLEAWEGEYDDFDFGRVHGTPLHWAIWHRNISAIRALTRADHGPDIKQVNRALLVAAAMHFYDVLEILKDWILSLKDFALSEIDWHTPFLFAVDRSANWLPKLLRHGSDKLSRALECTMDIILSFYEPPKEDFKFAFRSSLDHNNPTLLRYLYKNLNLGERSDILYYIEYDPVTTAISMGFIDIIEVLIEKGLISAHSEHSVEKFGPLQLCCVIRQSDPAITRRLLEIGCPVDGVGTTNGNSWTPFFIAVTFGMYHIAVILLEHGANKDHVSGWAGGYTVTMNLLLTWPDIPLSRLKFLLEEVPRLGFGHVTFWGWPGIGGNLMYALSLQPWASYTAGYRLGETAKYILSQLADKSCLNIIDKVGATALRMACACCNKEIIEVLIEAGQDVNLAMGYSPLRNAKLWLATCQKREKVALKGAPGSERRLARILRMRAEETVALLVRHGAIDRSRLKAFSNTFRCLASGQWQRPSLETVLEMFSLAIDPSPAVKDGSISLQPTTKAEFRVHHGQKSATQKLLGNLGRRIDKIRGLDMPKATPRYQPHNCLPWRSDNCVCVSHPAHVVNHPAPTIRSPTIQSLPFSPSTSDNRNLVNGTPHPMQWQSVNSGASSA